MLHKQWKCSLTTTTTSIRTTYTTYLAANTHTHTRAHTLVYYTRGDVTEENEENNLYEFIENHCGILENEGQW